MTTVGEWTDVISRGPYGKVVRERALPGCCGQGPQSTCTEVSYCRVDAGGAPAEWVEATVATVGQITLVYFVSDGYGVEALARSRSTAAELAVATGARVLTVACSPSSLSSHAVAIEWGMAVYAWLLGEGCELHLTAFTDDSTAASLADAIRAAALNQGLPVPAVMSDLASLLLVNGGPDVAGIESTSEQVGSVDWEQCRHAAVASDVMRDAGQPRGELPRGERVR